MIYFLFTVPFIISSFLGVITKRKNITVLFFLSIFLILFASLRDRVGTDWPVYMEFYTYSVHNVEIGYALLNNFFSSQGFPFYIFLLIINIISISLIYKSSQKLSLIPVLSLLIYYSDAYLYFNFSGMRQAVALSISTFALLYSFGERRNVYIYLSLILLAMSFHITAIIFSVAYFIPQRKFTKKEVAILIIVFMFFSSIVYFTSSFLTGIFASKAGFYLELQEQATNINDLLIIGLLRRSITILLVLFFGRKFIFKDTMSAYLFNLYLLGFGVYASSYLISPDIGVRMSVYFTVLEMFLLANLISLTKRADIKFIIYLLILAVCMYKVTTYIAIPAYVYKSIL